MSSRCLYILWDESHIWGLLSWKAAAGFGLPFRMVRAGEIAGGLLAQQPPAMLLVPGGTARHKAAALGPSGLQNIRDYVRGGGHYLGFCGGAGLGLTLADQGRDTDQGLASLNLCPWTRASFEDRMQHFMSGHLLAELAPLKDLPDYAHKLMPAGPIQEAPACAGYEPAASRSAQGVQDVFNLECVEGLPLLPVWWPGRFLPGDGEVAILARYSSPGPDFWLADLPIRLLPADAFNSWKELYGLNISPAFLEGQPCVAHGQYGNGTYTLSYSHLETPRSPFANGWLARIIETLGGISPASALVPAWQPEKEARAGGDLLPGLVACLAEIGTVMQTGLEHGLLFKRNDWLYGWRTGMPGSALNNLYSVMLSCAAQESTEAGRGLWREHAEEIGARTKEFGREAVNYLLAERLAMTLSKTSPEAVSSGHLKTRRQALFGPPMKPGGLYAKLTGFFEELLFLLFKQHQQ